MAIEGKQEITYELTLVRLRWVLLVALSLILTFILADLPLIPPILHHEYYVRTLILQCLPLLGLIAFTFYRRFYDFEHQAFFITLTLITFANYWLIAVCWQKQGVSFPYEGTILYAMFAFFVLRLNFKYAIAYTFLSVFGFLYLVLHYPIYGALNFVNFGFVVATLLICLVGLHTVLGTLTYANKLNEKLDQLSRVDQLSGLYNRRAYEADTKKFIEEAEQNKLTISVLLIDIDFFKDYNDAFGHQKGDAIIRIQAEILKSIFQRDTDIVGRYGGEEFIVISIGMEQSSAERMAELVIQSWCERGEQHSSGKGGDYVTCSVGIATTTTQVTTFNLHHLISDADKALYIAKNSGRGCYSCAKNTGEM